MQAIVERQLQLLRNVPLLGKIMLTGVGGKHRRKGTAGGEATVVVQSTKTKYSRDDMITICCGGKGLGWKINDETGGMLTEWRCDVVGSCYGNRKVSN